jgi:hypothetical protein
MKKNNWIIPGWSAPAGVRAVTTTRLGGVSAGNYASMNLALHVNDDESTVLQNRKLLREALQLRAEPCWLEQVHSTEIADLDSSHASLRADGSTTTSGDKVCVVMTADCLPVLLVDRKGERIMALHAGWRGLADGILEKGVGLYRPDQDVIAWLGPAIGPQRFEVGEEVVEQLMIDSGNNNAWYRPAQSPGKWMVNLYQAARLRLLDCGVSEIYSDDFCTFTDESRFYSYRRQGQCGRMATLVWFDHRGDGERT